MSFQRHVIVLESSLVRALLVIQEALQFFQPTVVFALNSNEYADRVRLD